MRVFDRGGKKALTRADLRAACAAIGGEIDKAKALICDSKPPEAEASTRAVSSPDPTSPDVRTR